MSLPTITLTTDFGLSDAYVAVMKAVMEEIAPGVRLRDISHMIAPQNVAGAGYVLLSSHSFYPPNCVHLAVVDPGVGTSRRAVAVGTRRATFVGPDNGLFAPVLQALGALDRDGALQGAEAVSLENRHYHRASVSHTFHGRDIFAPAAAYLASGVPLADLGPPVEHLVIPPDLDPSLHNGRLRGKVIHIDHFGNAITNISRAAVCHVSHVQVQRVVIRELARTYADGEHSLVALFGSSDRLEIAAPNGNAAAILGVHIGDEVSVW